MRIKLSQHVSSRAHKSCSDNVLMESSAVQPSFQPGRCSSHGTEAMQMICSQCHSSSLYCAAFHCSIGSGVGHLALLVLIIDY